MHWRATMPDVVEVLARCPACDGARLTELPTPTRWIGESVFAPCRDQLELCRCRDCDLVFVNPRPAAELLDRFYQSSDYGCHLPNLSAAATRAAHAQLAEVERVVSTNGRFLDFGCGGGSLLRVALAQGWWAIGYDIGAQALATCRAQGLPVTDDMSALGKHAFDAIYLSHVFEHVGTPGPLLAELRELLAPGGRLFIEVPNARSLRARLSLPALSRWTPIDERYRAFPIHLFYYSAASLRAMIERYGLRAVAHTTSGLGVDELIFHDEHEPPPSAGTQVMRAARSGWTKRLIKSAVLGSGLGENLVFVASA